MGTLNSVWARLAGQRVYIDTNYFIYFLTGHLDYAAVVAPLFQARDRGDILGMSGDAVLAEILVKPYREGDSATILKIKQFLTRENFITFATHDRQTFDLAAELRAQYGIKLIDALHFATAIKTNCRFFLSNDRAFKTIHEIETLNPSDFFE